MPLASLIPVWDHILQNAESLVPSLLNLQISLVILQLRQPQLKRLCSSNESDVQAAFTMLQVVQVPDGNPGWLLEKALQIPLSPAAVQEMRERLRAAVLERANLESVRRLRQSTNEPSVCRSP
jgi:hypothetical protein